MFDFFTYIIYISLLTFLVILTNYRLRYAIDELNFEEKSNFGLQHIIGLIIISFIVGFRYEVGVDWEGYRNVFQRISNQSLIFSEQYMEFGYFYINKFISILGLSYEWMFFSAALISWYFIFKSLPTQLLPLLVFFLFVDEYFFWSLNGVRQFIAISIWMFASKYIIDKSLIKYLVYLFVASLFHKSVLLLLPMYFIPFNRISNKYFWIAAFIITLIIGSSSFFIDYTKTIITNLGEKFGTIGQYVRYIDSNKFVINEKVQPGLGYLFKIVLNLIIILLSGRVIKQYPQTTMYFVLFFIGTILFNLSYNVQLLGRINNYFLIFRSVILAISVYYFWQTPKFRLPVIALFTLYLFLFIVAIYNSSNLCSPFQFSFNLH